MGQLAYYSILYYRPYATRNEQANVGILVRLASGEVRVHIAENLKKVLAIHPAANISEIRNLSVTIPSFLEKMGWSENDLFKNLSYWGKVTCFPEPCMFSYDGEENYERLVESILKSLVYPERKKPAQYVSDRLFTELKETFKAYHWLGAEERDLKKHMIVPRFSVAPDLGVKAEFALRNGKLHLIETVDFRSGSFSQKRQEAMSKMLVFDVAAQVNNESVNSYVIISGEAIKSMKPIVSLLDRYSENLVRWEVPGDVESFLSSIEDATGKKRMPLFPQPQ